MRKHEDIKNGEKLVEVREKRQWRFWRRKVEEVQVKRQEEAEVLLKTLSELEASTLFRALETTR